MPNSLRARINKLAYQGHLSREDTDRIRDALEKQIPMKMIQEEDTAHRLYCGKCHAYFGIYGDILIPSGSKYCYKCGQRIDWRD